MSIRDQLLTAIQNEEAVALATCLSEPAAGSKMLVYDDGRISGSISPERDSEICDVVLQMLPDNETGIREFNISDATVEIFIESYQPPRHLVVVGAVHTAIPLVQMAKIFDYKTTVIDARELFATRERFPHADRLIVAWPDEGLNTLNLGPHVDIVMLAHDPKFEDPAMNVALKSRAGYIGAMGSKKTSEERNRRLLDEGFSHEQINRIHGPVGLNIGGRSPQEIALSILAEIIAVRHGKDPKQQQLVAPAKSE